MKTFAPVSQWHHQIAFYLQEAGEKELETLLKHDIIKSPTGPTPWVSLIVEVPEKDTGGSVQICVDMQQANKVIERERHPDPHIADMLKQLNGTNVFSHLNLKKGYHQLELEKNCRYITAFSTHAGCIDISDSVLVWCQLQKSFNMSFVK